VNFHFVFIKVTQIVYKIHLNFKLRL
jgi:hypothetical protein